MYGGGHGPILGTNPNNNWIRTCTELVKTKFKILLQIIMGLELYGGVYGIM